MPQDLRESIWIVGDDAIDTHIDESLHFFRVIDGPRMDFYAGVVGGADEGWGNNREKRDPDGDLESLEVWLVDST